MIELTPLARPYAKALFASANEANSLEAMAIEDKMNHCLFLDYEALGSNFTSDEVASLDLCH